MRLKPNRDLGWNTRGRRMVGVSPHSGLVRRRLRCEAEEDDQHHHDVEAGVRCGHRSGRAARWPHHGLPPVRGEPGRAGGAVPGRQRLLTARAISFPSLR